MVFGSLTKIKLFPLIYHDVKIALIIKKYIVP
jgi:hypothetical protein